MKFISKITLALAFSVLSFTAFAQGAAEPQVMEFFHGDGCPHCANQWKFMPVIEKMYPDLEVREYEVWKNNDNQAFFNARMAELGTKAEGVPTNVIAGETIVNGFQPQGLIEALQKHYGAPALSLEEIEAELAKQETMSDNILYIIFGVLGAIFLGGVFFSMRKKK